MNDHPLNHLPEIDEIKRISYWLAYSNWSEGRGGNFSIRLESIPEELKEQTGGERISSPVETPGLVGQYLLLTGAGTRARDIVEAPHEGIGLFQINQDGKSTTYIYGNKRPTSEMPSHLAIHQALIEFRPEHRAVLHTHPPHLIAATHAPEFQNGEKMSDVLLRMQSETRLHLREGLAQLPYYLPGSLELGLASAEAVRRHRIVLWHFHGALATGITLPDALDHLQYLDKAAEVYWILRSAGIEPQGMSDEDIERALRHFSR